ncbi:hypothetical protein SDC9_53475 [bioreactor metagenome]|uniref:Uncharacterized protein n=1 Tax=bioreactor metagenome TaxID=1076179 RepID=A0A644WTV0_9ZZZZ
MRNTRYFFIALISLLTVIFVYFCSACAPGNTVALAETPEPTSTATATPAPTPSPTPTATPTPTIEPIRELTDEEAKKEIELLGMTVDPKDEIPLSNIFVIFCSELNEIGEKTYFVEFVLLFGKSSSNTMLLSRLWNDEYIYEFPSNGIGTVESLLDGVTSSPRFESLIGIELEHVTTFSNLEVFNEIYGIKMKKVVTPIGKEITSCQSRNLSQLPFTYEEIADYYVRAFAEENRMSAADYTDPIPYTPRTPAP